MDRNLDSRELRKQRIKRFSGYILIIIILVSAVFGIRQLLGRSIVRRRLLTTIAETGMIEGTVTATGTLVPVYEQVISTPFQSRIDSLYHQAGDQVMAGERLMKLNTDVMQMALEKAIDELELMKNQQRLQRLQMEGRRIDLETSEQIGRLQVAAFANELAVQKRLFDLGGSMQSSVDRAQLDLDISNLELEQLAKRLENEQKSFETELAALDLQISIKNNEILQLKRELDLADTSVLFDGVVTWINDKPGVAVYKGEALARIADLSHFKLRGAVSEYYADKLLAGVPVYIKVNNTRLNAAISSIEPTVKNGIITFYAELDEDNNAMLRSNMRVDINIIISSKNNVIRIKNGTAVNGHGQMYLFIDEGDYAVRRQVKIGETNLEYAEVISGIVAGETVIISAMEQYENLSRIKIIEN
ncbi:MAG: efflux RND transporter periplasmic adaptor subunit [Candidatus Cloacimonetes bacterium]|nr:efflux RND transporter periplasmic adaptor subunit [Candidatus Cloacimonadota bacterium]